MDLNVFKLKVGRTLSGRKKNFVMEFVIYLTDSMCKHGVGIRYVTLVNSRLFVISVQA